MGGKNYIKYVRLIAATGCLLLGKTQSAQTVTTFTAQVASYSWVVPAGVTTVTVQCWGGGGGGSSAYICSGSPGQTAGDGAGGGGAYASSVVTVTAGQTVTVVAGPGGSGGTAPSCAAGYNDGGNGTASSATCAAASFTVIAAAGQGSATSAGGTTGASTGTVKKAGGFGNSINSGGPSFTGGGGGGAGGSTAAGLPSSIGTSNTGGAGGATGGGNGGNGGSVSSTGAQAGNVGNVPGGGGGGGVAYTSGSFSNAGPATGGAGGGGQVVFTYNVVPSTLTLGDNHPAAANQCASTTNVILQSFSTAVSGGLGNLTDVSFTTTGTYAAADLSNFKLYYTTTSTFATTNLLATIASPATAGTQTFPSFSTPTLNNTTTYWFWITADIAASPTNGNTIAVNGIAAGNLTGGSTMAGSTTTAGGAQTIKTIPAQPSAITGTSPVCAGTNGVAYSVTNVAGVTYTWGYTGAGFTQASGGTTNSITANFSAGATSGNITVTPSNGGICSGTAQTYAVTINSAVPAQPSVVTGSSTVCQSQNGVAYSVTNVAGVTYTWTYTGTGLTVASGQGTNSITTNFSGTATSGNLTVTPSNACGNGTARTYAITVNSAPAQPSVITGTSPVCVSTNGVAYSVTNVGGVSYAWAYTGTGFTQASGGTTNSITVNYSGTATSGNITVTPSSGGCSGTAQTYAVTVNSAVPAQPSAITGTSGLCVSTNGVSYSVTNVAGVTYTWTYSGTGLTVASGQGTNSITANFSGTATSGNLVVTPSNSCGNGTTQTYAITVNSTVPAQPGTISGTTAQCASVSGQVYSISAVPTATTYNWTVPTGWNITTGSGTTSITVSTGTTGQNGNITVTAANNCGFSLTTSLAVTDVTCIPPVPTANAATNVDCGSFFANWTASSTATTYYIDVSTSNTFGSFVTGYNNQNTGNTLSYYVSGLASSTTYYYRVRAANSNGSSASSNVITVTTSASCNSPALGTWLQVGGNAGDGGGIDNGDPGHGDYEVGAETTDGLNTLYIGGYFTQVNNSSSVAAACIASWTPSTTYPYTTGTWANIGNLAGGLTVTNGGNQSNPSEVFAMTYYNGILYVGGNFTTVNGSATDGSGKSYNNLAKYTVATSTWSAVGGGGVTGGNGVGQAVMWTGGPLGGGGFYVQSLAVDSKGKLYVGGNFTSVAGTGGYNNIACWDPASSTWSNMGGGVTGTNSNSGTSQPTVYALDVVDDTHVYAGGQFSAPGSNIAMWNGSDWTHSSVGSTGIPQNAYYAKPCGGVVSGNPNWSSCPCVAALANVGTLVYAGGAFSKAGAVVAENIAQWNQGTSTWSDIGGVGGPSNDVGEVAALYANNGMLYVGGDFQEANSCGLTVNNIAEYDGWAAMPSSRPGFRPGLSNVLSITALANLDGVGNYGIVYAGGDYEGGTDASGNPTVNHIAQYAGVADGPIPLPITLLNFNAQYNQSSGVVDLIWETATEVNNKEFTIEKSKDGFSWEYVTSKPGAGNSSTRRNYSAVDEEPYYGTSYYRLKQTDYDGHFVYSGISPVTIDELLTKMTVVPNPANNSVTINFNINNPSMGELNVYDCTGRQVYFKQISTVKGINSILLNVSEYSNGVYFVTVSSTQNQYTAKMVVSH